MARRPSYYKDPLYSRWQTAVNRYLRKNSPVYINQDGRTLTMATCWQPPDGKGFVAFKAWVEEELRLHPEINPDEFRVLKHDKTKDFGPENCYLYQYGTGPRSRRGIMEDHVVKTPALETVAETQLDYPPLIIRPVSGLSMLEQIFSR